MGKELVVASDRHETRVAILEDGQLVEIYFQRANEYSLAGSIHKGRVTRVLPGMQSAFVDLGLERDTFLYVSDFSEEHGEDFEQVDERKSNGHNGHRPAAPPPAPVPAPAPSAVSFEAAAAAPVIEAGTVTADGAPSGPRDDRRFDRDDRRGGGRGRRRRRRSGPGGGGRFPDSKFASAEPAESRNDDEGPGAERPATFEPGETAEAEPIVLPGESLAKYRRANVGAARPEPVEISAESEDEDGGEEEAAAFVQNLLDEEESVSEEPVSEEPVSPTEPEATEPETVVENLVVEDLDDEDDDAPPALVAAVPEPDAPVHEDKAALEVRETEAAESESEEDPEEIDEVEAGEEAITALEPVEADVDEAAEPETEGEGQSAQVREQSGRFLQQRSGRRGRRRGRGGDRGDRADRGGERPADRPAAEAAPESRPERSDRRERAPQPSITDLLREGQEILVQIAKEPLGQKGARITSHIALPGRYCVYMPTVEHTGVSRKIASDEERARLKRILLTHKAGMSGGFIIRTAGEGRTEAEIAADIQYLYNLWLDIRQKSEKRKAPAVIYHDLDIVERILRDQLSEEFKAIWADSETIYESILAHVQRMQPALVNRVKMYTRSAPIFEAFSISSELEKALRPKVWLKSGGYIVINQTEALVAIDINTGKFIGKSNRLEDTIVRTNTEAVKEIVRQIRLRDLGGIIVIDFIDMDERKNRQKVMQALEEAMRADRAPYKILQFNDFGLVAITRKRVKQSLERTLCQPCPYCEGAGYVRSVQTVIGEILVEAKKIAPAVEGKECMLRANPEVAKVLKSTGNTYLEELEEILKRPVAVLADPQIHHEKFDLS
jgi:Rne/Rng family ribonuclease